MFGKKKQKKQILPLGQTEPQADGEKKEAVEITTMPSLFYGGADPEIYKTKTSSTSVAAQKKEAQKKEEPKEKDPPKPPPRSGKHLAPVEKKKKPERDRRKRRWPIILLILLIFLGIIGTVWYVLTQTGESEPTITPPPPTLSTTTRPLAPPPAIRTTTPPTTTPPVTTTPEATSFGIEFPPQTSVDSIDFDADALTDREEELLGVDPGIWDTDGDGYYDGQEVFNLYSPRDEAPTQLIDSGIVREYINPVWQYRLYYPASWQATPVGNDVNHILFSSIAGDYVEVIAVPKENTDPFTTWFALHAEGERITDILSGTNRFQVDYLKRKDDLVTYFERDDVIFVLLYHPADTGFASYRNIMKMMYQSFRPTNVLVEIPEQDILPPVVTTTPTTGATSTASTTTTEETVTSTIL